MQWHNKFHLEMPKGLVNDPNGLCYHKDKSQKRSEEINDKKADDCSENILF